MCSKLNILFLSFFLMTFQPLLSQAQEQFTEPVTESISEPTIQPQSDDIYLTCDFDLENIESLLQYLPDICMEIYYSRINDSSLYDLYLEESQNFAKFYKKLNDYELRNQPNHDKEELSDYPFETHIRREAYAKADWSQCIAMSNNSVTDYLNCLNAKRLELADLIPNVETEIK